MIRFSSYCSQMTMKFYLILILNRFWKFLEKNWPVSYAYKMTNYSNTCILFSHSFLHFLYGPVQMPVRQILRHFEVVCTKMYNQGFMAMKIHILVFSVTAQYDLVGWFSFPNPGNKIPDCRVISKTTI